MRLRMIHQAGYEFDCEQYSVLGEARLQPQFTQRQTILASDVNIEPTAWRMDYIDYWGAHVVAFNAHVARGTFKVTATTDLEVELYVEESAPGLGWVGLGDVQAMDALAEFLEVDENYLVDPEIQELRQQAADPMAFLHGLGYQGKLMGDDAALDDMIAALRWAGIPTRVVSGYLIDAELPLRSIRDAAVHGWLQIWDGSWLGWDPRLACVPDQRHIVMATARQRADIPVLTAVNDCDQPARGFQEVSVERIA